jgi:putative membrane-bound dehydrogenase-like protein
MGTTLEADSRLCGSPPSRQEDLVMRRSAGGLLWLTILAGAAPAFGQAPPARAIRRVLPKEPAEALAAFRVRDDFVIDLIAQEPLVNDPVAFAYDEDGRMYVVEMLDYPLGAKDQGQPIGMVRLLEDDDGDGRFDRSHVFADRLPQPSAVAVWRGGVFVAAAPDIWYFRDRDGDGRADLKEKVYTGFGTGHLDLVLNHLQWGVDNRFYGATNHNGGTILGAGKSAPADRAIAVRGRDFRFDPISGRFEAITGADSRWGNCFDDWYNRFVCENIGPARHVLLPIEYLARNPHLSVPRLYESLVKEGGDVPVYRISPPEPWREVRAARRRALGKDANPGEINAAGYFTSACAITVYRGSAYPEAYRGNLFICEPAGNLVHRRVMTPEGVSFTTRRGDEGQEFLAAADNWFRPVALVNAPDGTLHLADMYREVVEAPEWVPEDLKAQGLVQVEAGRDRGRIYRIRPPGFRHPPPPRLSRASGPELAAQLENPNPWWRETAQRLIYERRDRSAVEPLRRLARTSQHPLTWLHALWTLEGVGALQTGDIAAALGDRASGVREHAVRLAEPRLEVAVELREQVIALADDPAPRVRLQVALSLGGTTDVRAVAALRRIARHDLDDPWIRAAVFSSTATTADRLFELLLDDPEVPRRQEEVALLRELAVVVGARDVPEEIRRVLTALTHSLRLKAGVAIKRSLVLGLGEGLRRARGDAWKAGLAEATRPFTPWLADLIQRSSRTATDPEISEQERRDAIALLSLDDFAQAKAKLAPLLNGRQPTAVQMASAQALATFDQAEAATLLLQGWAHCTPAVRGEILADVLGRKAWHLLVLKAAQENPLLAAQIGPTQRSLLLKHEDRDVRVRAGTLFGPEAPGPRQEILARYGPALARRGDRARGQAVFERECVSCHRFGAKGYDVGPNLSSYSRNPTSPQALLTQILDPNREVAPDYVEYVAALDDGRVVTGLIVAETPTSLTLRRDKNTEVTIARQRIDEIRATGKSLMPEGLERNVSVVEMADLLAFLMAANESF